MASGRADEPKLVMSRRDRLRRNGPRIAGIVVILLMLCVCCDVPEWPTLAWEAAAQNCGQLTFSAISTQPQAQGATQAETCFVHAYQHCTAAKLGANFLALDSSTSDEFVIEPYGVACVLAVIRSSGGRTPFQVPLTHVQLCGGMRQEADGLHVQGCQFADGDIIVPAGL